MEDIKCLMLSLPALYLRCFSLLYDEWRESEIYLCGGDLNNGSEAI
jgi:hypothetical protein